MTSAMLKQTRWTILLSLNAVAIVVAGILIASAISGGGFEFKAVAERSDEVEGDLEETEILTPVSDSQEAVAVNAEGKKLRSWVSTEPVAGGELWNEEAIAIYQTADIDICVGGGLSGLGKMYWQSSNQNVISGFYATARTWLGYSTETCRYPIIKGTGTTTITAGTYDGARRDSITVTVVEVPVEDWKREVLELVNKERAKVGVGELGWGTTCEAAASIRARELMNLYSHTRPDGSSWETACPIPTEGGWSGENLMAGNAAVSPETVVEAWMNSPDHRKNILSENFTKLSVGFIFDPESQYKTYWSQYFSTY
ncbi:CAP domain-containing protein [Candidatus Saccharibacteria bacterium]|nr:CAP domain-containing protein [Candidatus Saccharibacteria bacterium]